MSWHQSIIRAQHIKWSKAFVVALMVLTIGCTMAKSVQTYPGPARSADQHATVRTVNSPSALLYMVQVDDQKVLSMMDQINGVQTHEVTVLPGTHKITFELRVSMARGGGEVSFNAKAGSTYIGKSEAQNGKFDIWIEDERSGEIVGRLSAASLSSK